MKIIDIFSGNKNKGKSTDGILVTEGAQVTPVEIPATSPATSHAEERTVIALDDRSVEKIASALDFADRKKNRRRWFWLLGVLAAFALLVVGGIAMLISSGGTGSNKLEIKKEGIVTLPVAGAALASAKNTAHIAVIKIDGEIGGSLHGRPTAGNTALYVHTALALAENDPDLAGVILEINSPGGGAAASDEASRFVVAFRERMKKAKRNVPVIAYTETGAYSGGYFIAVGADKIYADRGANVANIGVIMRLFNTEGLGQKFGIKENVITTGPIKSVGGQWGKLTPSQEAVLQDGVDDSFDDFLEAVSKSRGIPFATLKAQAKLESGSVSNGAFFSAKRALGLKLIDKIVPVEDLYPEAANTLPDKQKYNAVEFQDYQKQLGITEELKLGGKNLFVSALQAVKEVFFTEAVRGHSEIRAE